MTAPVNQHRDGSGGANHAMTVAERGCDVVVVVFAWFTVIAHASVFLVGLSFSTFRWLAFSVVPVAFIGWRVSSAGFRISPSSSSFQPVSRIDREVHLIVVGLITVTLSLGMYEVFWIGAMLFLGAIYLRSHRYSGLSLPSKPITRPELLVLFSIVLVSASLVLAAHFPNSDDGFLLNLSVWALDNPGSALYSADGLHNIPGLPLILAAYKSHSLELLYSWLAWLFRIEPITVAHLVLPPLSAAAAVLAAALLMRVLSPKGWLAAVVVVVLFWLTMGDTTEGFARHAYVRLFQGKAVMVTALLPYLSYCVIRYMVTGGLTNWALVLACTVCASGLSASGLFVAPLALGAVSVACWRLDRATTLRLVAALAAVLYPLSVAMAVRPDMLLLKETLNGVHLYGALVTFPLSLERIVGSGFFLCLQLGGILASVALAPNLEMRRWLAGLLLAYFAVAIDPYVYDVMVSHVTSAPVAWRLLWMVPVPHLVACAFAFPLASAHSLPIRKRVIAIGALTLAIVLVFSVVPRKWAISESSVDEGSMSSLPEVNQVLNLGRFGPPDLKVPVYARTVSEFVRSVTGPDEAVLAPRELDIWLTVFRGHPRVVAHKHSYLQMIKPFLGPEELELRMHLLSYVGGTSKNDSSASLLAAATRNMRIGAIVSASTLPWWREIDSVAHESGMVRTGMEAFTVWHRPQQ